MICVQFFQVSFRIRQVNPAKAWERYHGDHLGNRKLKLLLPLQNKLPKHVQAFPPEQFLVLWQILQCVFTNIAVHFWSLAFSIVLLPEDLC